MRDVLQVAIARLVGYRWPAEIDESMRLDIGARAWVTKCRELDAFVDEDGIVGIGAVRGEASAADRIRELLTAAFVDVPGGFTAARERELIVAAADGGQPAESLDAWLREQFFEQHCKVFHQRPFVWHIWDGRADGFNVLVNYHRLAAPSGEGRRTLSALMDSYLGNWIERQNSEVAEKIDGADGRLAAAMRLQNELQKILAGEPPYDIFVRWKPLHEQPLGWEPDINDGVRMNIRPFMAAKPLGARARDACILRTTPKIKWDKDRGKEQQRPHEDFPWFWNWDKQTPDFEGRSKEPDGNRWNDLHYTRAFKEAARARKVKS